MNLVGTFVVVFFLFFEIILFFYCTDKVLGTEDSNIVYICISSWRLRLHLQ